MYSSMARRRFRLSRRQGQVILIVAIAAVSSIAASMFADATQAARVAGDGAIFTASQQLGASAGVVKGNLGLTIVLVSAEQAGVQVEDDVSQAIARVRSDVGTLRTRAEALDLMVGGSTHSELAARVEASADEALTLLENAGVLMDAESADDLARTTVLPVVEQLEAAAADVGRAAQARIEAEQSSAGEAARITSLTVALIVPSAAAWGLWATARRREERLAMQSQLDHNLALIRARDDLIGGLSHQLRTPLTAITGYTQAMLEIDDDPELMAEGLTVIDEQAAELTRMVDDLVVMARLEDGGVEYHMQRVDPIREIETVISSSSAWEGRVQTMLSPTTVWTDRLRLRHILTNLLSNAVRHGGPSVIVKSAPAGGMYRIVVADNGAGLSSTQIDGVFQPYVHTPRDALVTGTLGLGLAVAKRLAGSMGCRLSYERMNGYTLFVLDVPLAPGVSTLALESPQADVAG